MLATPEHILILEDDDELRTVLSEVLRDEGFEVAAAASAMEAIQRADETGFDLIIADIRMAGMDGLHAVEAVRHTLPQIRTIVMSGYSSEADSVRALQLGIQDYLRKPFEIHQFLATVHRQIQNRRNDLRIHLSEKASRGLVVWTLESQLGPSDRGVSGLARLAYQVATHLGLSEAQAQECQILVLAEYLRRNGKHLEFGLLQETLGQGLRSWLHQVDDGPDGEEPNLVMRIARQALQQILTGQQGDKDSELVQAFQNAARSDTLVTRSNPQASRRRGSLLTLAQAFERSNPAEAERIYRELIQENSPTQESLSAYQGLLRLQPSQFSKLLTPALTLARQVGPLAYAQTALALALMQGGREGINLLATSGRVFAQLPGSTGACRAQLAQFVLEERPLDERLIPLLQQLELLASGTDWQSCAPWLLPYLARVQSNQSHPEISKALLRLAHHGGASFLQHLGVSPLEERRTLLRVFQEHPGPRNDALLRPWEAQEQDSEIRAGLRNLLHQEPIEVGPSLLKIFSIGTIQIYFGKEPLPDSAWSNRKQLLLLIYLAAFPGTHTEDAIIDRLWPDKDPVKGRNNINSALSHIRKVLKSQGADPALLQRDKRGLWLDKEVPHWHDLSEFQTCLDQSSTADNPTRQQELLRQACALYRGSFIADYYFDWADPLRQYLENRLVEALLQLSELCLQGGQHLEALAHSHRLLEVDPCCQQACLAAMKAYIGLSRSEEAIRIFDRVTRSLREELAMEPSTVLLEWRQRALLSLGNG
ncbi:MAG: response regulator [Vulcanimicrobiota bacterium]